MTLKDFDVDDLRDELWKRGYSSGPMGADDLQIVVDRCEFREVVDAAMGCLEEYGYDEDETVYLAIQKYKKILDAR